MIVKRDRILIVPIGIELSRNDFYYDLNMHQGTQVGQAMFAQLGHVNEMNLRLNRLVCD
jgi:hypothetical protein